MSEGDQSVAPTRAAAIVGAGPAGLYALAALLRGEAFDQIDIFEAAPAPYGLIRYGVAPDHPKTRTITRVLAQGLRQPRVRFLGNVTAGRDVSVAELRAAYDAVVISTGMLGDRRLMIPGEDLEGSYGASELVAWYTGHPQARSIAFPDDLQSATVIGAGNVALDLARILSKNPAAFLKTSMPRHVVDVLAASSLTDVHVVARRGPAQAKFTSPELHEIGDLEGVDVVVDPADLVLGPDDEADMAADRRARVTVNVCRSWVQRQTVGAPRRIHFHFWSRPTRIIGPGRVASIELEGTRSQQAGKITIATEMVIRAIGYHSAPIPGLPFNEGSGTVPSRDGRVIVSGPHGGDTVLTGVYVTGWLRRGPTGVIATNRSDANEVADSVLSDMRSLTTSHANPAFVDDLLNQRGVRVITWEDWLRLESYEKAYGAALEADPIVVHDLKTVLDVIETGRL
jgi:ferredoxin--NADP+ reductase